MKKWRCTVCGEIVESDVRPDKCPRCKVPGEKFVEVVEDGAESAASGRMTLDEVKAVVGACRYVDRVV